MTGGTMPTRTLPTAITVVVVQPDNVGQLAELVAATPEATLATMAIDEPTMARLPPSGPGNPRDYKNKTHRPRPAGGGGNLVPDRDAPIAGRTRGWRPDTALAWLRIHQPRR